jgi:uncharacterized membrane protein YphA (DoxX/SURF4 family)
VDHARRGHHRHPLREIWHNATRIMNDSRIRSRSRLPDIALPTSSTFLRAILFRFAFIYWIAIVLVLCAGEDTGVSAFGKVVGPIWNPIVVWIGKHVLGIAYELHPGINGSVDKTTDWIGVLVAAVAAAVGSLVWALLDHRRRHDDQLRSLLRVILRYTAACVVLGYGLSKLLILQFPQPGVGRLLERFGDFSPMGLVWTFMGASPVYVFFAGASETLGAVLLLFRRTTTLGALIVAMVMVNVSMLNLCYDVCEKISSLHLVGMCVFLLLPDLGNLANVVVFRRPTQPAADEPALFGRRLRRTRWILKCVMIGYMVIFDLVSDLPRFLQSNSHTWCHGYWGVTSFTRDGQNVPPIVTDATRWGRIRFQDTQDQLLVRWRFMDESLGVLYTATLDDTRKTMTLTPSDLEPPKHPTGPVTFHYTRTGPDQLALEGAVDAATLSVRLERLDGNNMLLLNRGFHWINEEPFSR